MEYQFIIYGRLNGLNEYTGANRTNPYKGGKMKKKNEEIVIWAIQQQLKQLHIKKPVKIQYTFYEQNRRRDIDNISSFAHKVIQDALVRAGVLKNDGWKEIVGYSDSFQVDQKNPRIEITLIEIE